MTIAELFVGHSVNKLEQMTGHIEDCLGRLSEDEIWRRGSEPENCVGNLVLHLCGNLGQWIGHYVAQRPDRRQHHQLDPSPHGVFRFALTKQPRWPPPSEAPRSRAHRAGPERALLSGRPRGGRHRAPGRRPAP